MTPLNLNFPLLFPELLAFGILLLLMIGEIAARPSDAPGLKQSAWITARIGVILVFGSALLYSGKIGTALSGMFIVDPFSTFFKVFFALTVFVVIPMSKQFFLKRADKPGEFLLVLWSSLIGLFFLVSANDFLMMFVALEIFTLSLYILAAYLKRDLLSIEAGLKYLIIGSLASAFMIYGIALTYTASGSTSFPDIRDFFAADPDNKLMILGLLMIISALGFKVASVPFQLWVADVYEGSPTPVVGYLSTASKAAGFALLLRVLFTIYPVFSSGRELLFSALAAMTLFYGNLAALLQTNIKRLFGYSSIGHASYLLIGVAAGKTFGVTGVLYYLMAYAVTNLAAFYVITFVGRETGSDQIDAYRGLSKRSPFLAGTLFLSLLSLAGVPPLAGFFGKFLVLFAAVKSGMTWVALLGAVGVAISLYYYLNLVRVMYFEKPLTSETIDIPLPSKVMLLLLIAGILILGFWQLPFYTFAEKAASSLF